MAKDPAFLFYPGDWLGGTMLLTRHQKGCYIDLLMAQFNYGPLSLEQIKILLGTDQASWTVLQAKFKKDANGNFFNEKLATEIEKRKNFVSSRGDNKRGKTKSYNKSCENHMINHMENENVNKDENEISSFGKSENLLKTNPKIEEVERFFLQQGGTKEQASAFFNRYEAVEWKIRGTPVKNYLPLIGNFIKNWNENQKNGTKNNPTGNGSNRDKQAAAKDYVLNKLRGIISE